VNWFVAVLSAKSSREAKKEVNKTKQMQLPSQGQPNGSLQFNASLELVAKKRACCKEMSQLKRGT
jgi:hypothetical protein